MFKVNNEDLASFWCLYSKLRAHFIPCSSVSIVNFEHVTAEWEVTIIIYCFYQIFFEGTEKLFWRTRNKF